MPLLNVLSVVVGLELPGVSHHEVKIGIVVYGGTHTRVVVEKFLLSDLRVGMSHAPINTARSRSGRPSQLAQKNGSIWRFDQKV